MTFNLRDCTGMTEVAAYDKAQPLHIEYRRQFWDTSIADNLVDYSEIDGAAIDAIAATWTNYPEVVVNVEGGTVQGTDNWNVSVSELDDESLAGNVDRYVQLITRIKQTYTGRIYLWSWGPDPFVGYWNRNRALGDYFALERVKKPVYDLLDGLMPNLYCRETRMPRFRDQVSLQLYLASQYGKPVIPSTWHRFDMDLYHLQYMDGYSYGQYMGIVREYAAKYGADSIMLWASSDERGYSTTQTPYRYNEPSFQNPDGSAQSAISGTAPSTDRAIQVMGFNGPTYKERAGEWFRTLKDFDWI